jgi:hypothetical protein
MPRRAQGTRTASPPIHRHRQAAVPGGPTVTTFHLSQGPRPAPRKRGKPQPPFRQEQTQKPVSPFVVVRLGLPARSSNGPSLPCNGIRFPQRGNSYSYSGHTPTLQRLNHAADIPRTGYHPGSYRASRISDRRLPIGHVTSPPTAGRFTSYAEPPGPAQFPASQNVT